MKLPSISLTLPFALLATLSSLTSAHMTIQNPLPRAHPLNPNAATKDFDCIMAPLNGGGPCAPKPFPCGGYPQDTKITQTFRAGEVITVEFFNQNFPSDPSNSDPNADQARHNGGQCEFSLSYDGGKTYTVIGSYKKTCPDIFFGWKVKIPQNAPSCDNPGQCLFSWSWINAVGNREFYQNCADIKIEGNSTKALPIIDITRANLPPQFPQIITPPGDPANTGNAKGSGPSQMACVNPGKTGDFTTCANGKLITRSCAATLVCKTAGTSIACDYA
ncbi:1926_t:CDS:2 [Paraglomus brasilianum]|uniref:1926_t:CDS:1 n=1 Tax=Paraglomus brasilianum TaxID=144538 RepID=A0A9N9FJX2_9GLOM|nr:1926_t:CDS:2 [Paraglomus brasilianum]